MSEPCKYEEKIGEITAILAKISADVYGNGQEGLVKTIPRLEGKIDNLGSTTAAHTNIITKLVEFQATHNGKELGKKEVEARQIIADNLKRQRKKDMFWKIATILTIIITATGVFIAFDNRMHKSQAQLRDEIEMSNQMLLNPVTRGNYYDPFANDTIK